MSDEMLETLEGEFEVTLTANKPADRQAGDAHAAM